QAQSAIQTRLQACIAACPNRLRPNDPCTRQCLQTATTQGQAAMAAYNDCSARCSQQRTLCRSVCQQGCGGGPPCAAGYACSNGKCCPAGQTNCGGVCVDTRTDRNNCGACGNV